MCLLLAEAGSDCKLPSDLTSDCDVVRLKLRDAKLQRRGDKGVRTASLVASTVGQEALHLAIQNHPLELVALVDIAIAVLFACTDTGLSLSSSSCFERLHTQGVVLVSTCSTTAQHLAYFREIRDKLLPSDVPRPVVTWLSQLDGLIRAPTTTDLEPGVSSHNCR